MLRALTVEENLQYSAALRLPAGADSTARLQVRGPAAGAGAVLAPGALTEACGLLPCRLPRAGCHNGGVGNGKGGGGGLSHSTPAAAPRAPPPCDTPRPCPRPHITGSGARHQRAGPGRRAPLADRRRGDARRERWVAGWRVAADPPPSSTPARGCSAGGLHRAASSQPRAAAAPPHPTPAQAGSASASTWGWSWWPSPRSYSWTNPPAGWTAAPAGWWSKASRWVGREAGRTCRMCNSAQAAFAAAGGAPCSCRHVHAHGPRRPGPALSPGALVAPSPTSPPAAPLLPPLMLREWRARA
jgi:hypothetical protein